MRRVLVAIVALLGGLLAAWLGSAPPAVAASSAPSMSATAYIYGSHHSSLHAGDNAAGRGPLCRTSPPSPPTTGVRVLVADGEFSAIDPTGVAANTGDDVVRALSTTERRTLDDALRPDKLDHIFDPKHNFQPLVQQFGSREAAMEQIVRSIGSPLPQAGRFEIAQSIGGQTVIIRGAVVDGIPRIGTAFTP